MRKNVIQNTREKGREKHEENAYPYARFYVLEKSMKILLNLVFLSTQGKVKGCCILK